MFKEIWNGFSGWLKERLTSPLLSTFIITWMVCNHRYLMVMFSDEIYESKFRYFDSYIPSNFLNLTIWPIVTTAAFLFFYPVIRNKVYVRWEKFNTQLENFRLKNSQEQLVTQEQYAQIVKDKVQLEQQYRAQIQDREIVIQNLEAKLSDLGNSLDLMMNEKKSEQLINFKEGHSQNQLEDAFYLILNDLEAAKPGAINADILKLRLQNILDIDDASFKRVIRRALVEDYIINEASPNQSTLMYAIRPKGTEKIQNLRNKMDIK